MLPTFRKGVVRLDPARLDDEYHLCSAAIVVIIVLIVSDDVVADLIILLILVIGDHVFILLLHGIVFPPFCLIIKLIYVCA